MLSNLGGEHQISVHVPEMIFHAETSLPFLNDAIIPSPLGILESEENANFDNPEIEHFFGCCQLFIIFFPNLGSNKLKTPCVVPVKIHPFSGQ